MPVTQTLSPSRVIDGDTIWLPSVTTGANPIVGGPFYFAWIDAPDPAMLANGHAFNPSLHARMDEFIFHAKITLKEGDKPTLDLVIKNPHIGLLNDSRRQWAWFSRLDEATGHIVPKFCGRLVSAPKNIFKEQMQIQLVAWPIDYFEQLQAQAEFIRQNGPYDPAWIEATKRDDPDTILEALSALYHVDPVTHLVTISDIIAGEDGAVVVTQDDHLYGEMEVEFDQTTQITKTLMVATVSWNQTGQGYIQMTPQTIGTYAGDAVISEWPKPLASLGAGYTVAFSDARDTNGIAAGTVVSAHAEYTNTDETHEDGDCLSWEWSQSVPDVPCAQHIILFQEQVGLQDPFTVDGNGDPAPTNISPWVHIQYAYAGIWNVKTTLTLQYRDLQRTRTERLQMMLTSDLQNILVDPLVTQDSEVITKQSVDLSQPILITDNWSTIAGQFVDLDVIVFPNDPSLPSLRTAQICVQAGTAGTVEPDFSDVPGAITIDGTVHWASLGQTAPPDTAYDWTPATNVPTGEWILPRKPLFIPYNVLIESGIEAFPPVGVQVSRGQIMQLNGFYYVCTIPGLTSVSTFTFPALPTSYGAAGMDNSVQWTCLGNSLPDGKTHFIATTGGKTGPEFMIPPFNNTLHAKTTDGTVVWSAVGTGDLPIGGTPGDTWARTYFDTARGRQSVEYLVSILRARALMKARAVTLTFTPINPSGSVWNLDFTCRKDAVVYDTRLAGGFAEGKIIQVEYECDGATGQETCRVQVGCCIGKDNVVEEVTGTSSYSTGTYDTNYEQFTGQVVLVGDNSDVGYTPPVITPNDDGLVFPLTYGQVVIDEQVLGGGGAANIGRVFAAMQESTLLSQFQAASGSISYSTNIQRQIQLLSAYSINWATASDPKWYNLVLKPLSGLQFNNNCVVQLTPLTCRKGIDLTGASTP